MRYFVVSILVHILLIQFIWVGFSVPAPKDQNSFTYWSSLAGTEENMMYAQGASKGVDFSLSAEPSSDSFEPWLKMRELNKPR